MNAYIYVFLKEEVLKSKDFKLNTTSPFKGEICGIKVSRKDHGELYFMVACFDIKLPYGVAKEYIERTEVTCIFTPDQGLREKGIYRIGKITAELDRSIMHKDHDYILEIRGPGYRLKEMEALYHEIRAGNIKPDPSDSYEKEQCKEDMRLSSVLIRKLENIFFKRYFFPGGFGREVVKIVKEAKSSLAT